MDGMSTLLIYFSSNYFISLTKKTLWEKKVFEILTIWKRVFYTFRHGYLDMKFQVRKNFLLMFLMSLFHYLLASNILLKSSVSIWFIVLPVKPIIPLFSDIQKLIEDLSYLLCWTYSGALLIWNNFLYSLWQPSPTTTTTYLFLKFLLIRYYAFLNAPLTCSFSYFPSLHILALLAGRIDQLLHSTLL